MSEETVIIIVKQICETIGFLGIFALLGFIAWLMLRN